jgi:hypothetical protein
MGRVKSIFHTLHNQPKPNSKPFPYMQLSWQGVSVTIRALFVRQLPEKHHSHIRSCWGARKGQADGWWTLTLNTVE